MLGVCALVFATVGIGASGAQAAGSWLVLEGGGIVTEGSGGELILESDINATLHSKISGVSVLLECPTILTLGAKLATTGTIATGAKIKFTGCIPKLNGTTSAPCEPTNAGTEKGVISTKALHAAFVLNAAKEELIQFIPDEGETIWTTEMGNECSLGTKIPVIGKVFLKDCQGAFLTHLPKHLVEEGPGTELWTISKTEEHKAKLLGSAWAKVRTGGVFREFAGHAG
jgi:hypothetical protein